MADLTKGPDDLIDLPEKPLLTPCGRVTWGVVVYYEQCGQPTHEVRSAGDYRSYVDEQAYRRTSMIDAMGWTKLDPGWYSDTEKIGMIVLENKKKTAKTPVPIAPVLLALKFSDGPPDSNADPDMLIDTGDCLFFRPHDVGRVWLKAAEGLVQLVTHIMPK